MKAIDPSELEGPQRHHLLLGSVGPRPICFASTIDAEGRRNLSPFSFFNVFSSSPPTLIFSPARSGRTGKTKNTHDNVLEVPEVVINVVTYDMVEQMSLSSSPYPKGVDEFVKSGFTPIDSDLVKPARVAESPIQIECIVKEVIELGTSGGSGNLVVCEAIRIHVDENLLDDSGKILQDKVDLVARMGGNFYCRAYGDALFEIPKPLTSIGVGVDALPDFIRQAPELTGNHIGKLGQMEALPEQTTSTDLPRKEAIEAAIKLLQDNDVEEAYKLLAKNLSK